MFYEIGRAVYILGFLFAALWSGITISNKLQQYQNDKKVSIPAIVWYAQYLVPIAIIVAGIVVGGTFGGLTDE